MKGNNVLQLNIATMIEAVEYWMKNVLLKDDKFEITDIRTSQQNDYMFEIHLKGLEETEE